MNLTVMHHPDLVSVAIGKILQYDPYENFSLIITDSYKRKIVSFRRLFHPVSCLHKTSWFSLFPRDPRTERLVCTDQGKFFHRGPGSPWIPAFPYPVFENFPYPNWISFGIWFLSHDISLKTRYNSKFLIQFMVPKKWFLHLYIGIFSLIMISESYDIFIFSSDIFFL